MSGSAKKKTSNCPGKRASLSVASVMTPRVPSLPMKSCLKSRPVLFFSSAPLSSRTDSIHRDDLKSQDPLTSHTVMNDFHSAGVRRDVTADLTGSLGREIDRPGETVRLAVLVNRLGDGSGLNAHRVRENVDRIHPGHFRKTQNDLAVGCDRSGSEPCASARRDHSHSMLLAKLEKARDLIGRSRKDDRRRIRRVNLGPVASVDLKLRCLLSQEVLGKSFLDVAEKSLGQLGRRHIPKLPNFAYS